MANEISVASLIISIIILIVVIVIIILICYANNSNSNNKQIKDNFVARPVINCAPHWYSFQYGTSQCCGAQDSRVCTTEVYGKNGHCNDGYCDL